MPSTLEKELANALINGKPFDTASAAIAGAATLNLIAAPGATKRLQIWRIWVGNSNTHGSEVGTINFQDTTGSPIDAAHVRTHFATTVNGFIELAGHRLAANKGLDAVVASGTQAGKIIVYYRVVDA